MAALEFRRDAHGNRPPLHIVSCDKDKLFLLKSIQGLYLVGLHGRSPSWHITD